MSGKMYEKQPEEDARYHDTWRLLKKYRDVIWSLEVSVQQVKNQFRIDYDCSIEDFLESVYMAGADLGGTDIENHARCIERSYKMLTGKKASKECRVSCEEKPQRTELNASTAALRRR